MAWVLLLLLLSPLVHLQPLPQGFLLGDRDAATITLLLPTNPTKPWEIKPQRIFTPPLKDGESDRGVSTIAACIIPNTTTIVASTKHWICGTTGGAFPQSLGCLIRYSYFNRSDVTVLVSHGQGELRDPAGITVGNGTLYVIDTKLPAILAFNSTTGAFIDRRAILPSTYPQRYHLRWGPDGFLYCNDQSSVLQIHPITGKVTTFTKGGPMNQVRGLLWSSGVMYVASRDYGAVLTYDSLGNYIKELVPRATNSISPQGLEVGEGGLYVLLGNGTVVVFDLQSGDMMYSVHTPSGTVRAARTLLRISRVDLLEPPCMDKYQDDMETDVDCGGGGCTARCGHEEGCLIGDDCESGVPCLAGKCNDPNALATVAWPLLLDSDTGDCVLFDAEGTRVREYSVGPGGAILDVVVVDEDVWALTKGAPKGCENGEACLVQYNYFTTTIGKVIMGLGRDATKIAPGKKDHLLVLNTNQTITVVNLETASMQLNSDSTQNPTHMAGAGNGAYSLGTATIIWVTSESGVSTNYTANAVSSMCMASANVTYYLATQGSGVALFRAESGTPTVVHDNWSTLTCTPTLVWCPTTTLILVGCKNMVGLVTAGTVKTTTLTNKASDLKPIAISGPMKARYTLPPCSDAIKDDKETDQDCGGGVCGRCGLNKACELPMDCEEGLECNTKHQECRVPKPPTPAPQSSAFLVSEREGNMRLVSGTGEVLRVFGTYRGKGVSGAVEWGIDSLLVVGSSQICNYTNPNVTHGGLGCLLKYNFFNSTIVSIFIRGEGGLKDPKDIIFDEAQGALYVLEPSRIVEFNSTGHFVRLVADLPDYGLRSYMTRVGVNTLLVPDRSKVLQVDIHTGKVKDLATDGQLNIVMGLFVDVVTGILYACSRDYGAVSKYNVTTGDFLGYGAKRGSAGSPVDVVVVGGELYVLTGTTVSIFNSSNAEFIRTVTSPNDLRGTPRHLTLLTHPSFVADPCNDTHKDDAETDVDCGGPRCGGCGVGSICAEDDDCASIFLCNSSRCSQPLPPPTAFHVEFELWLDNTTLQSIPHQKTGMRDSVADVGKLTIPNAVITNVTWGMKIKTKTTTLGKRSMEVAATSEGGVFNFSLGVGQSSSARAVSRLLEDAQTSGALLQTLQTHDQLSGVTVATVSPPRVVAVDSGGSLPPPSTPTEEGGEEGGSAPKNDSDSSGFPWLIVVVVGLVAVAVVGVVVGAIMYRQRHSAAHQAAQATAYKELSHA